MSGFSGRRAGVFFSAYLNERIDKPILSPEVTTINELVARLSDLQQADPVSLVLKLQEVYSQVTGHQEPLDEFFFWGEILLADFDDIDKYLLNADDLFRNIADLKELENQFDYLTANRNGRLRNFGAIWRRCPARSTKRNSSGSGLNWPRFITGLKPRLNKVTLPIQE